MSNIEHSAPKVKGKLKIVKTAKPAVPAFTPLSPKADAIQKLLSKVIEAEPFEHSGFVWAKKPQKWWEAQLDISDSTFRRCISKPPFVREAIKDPDTGNKVTLIREGVAGPKTKRHLQNILSSTWRKHTGLTTQPTQYGHMGGMVDHWGDKAPIIFKLSVTQWQRFMAGVKLEIAKLGDEGKPKYFVHPSTSVILRFHMVATEMYLMDQQEKNGLNADYGGLWFAS